MSSTRNTRISPPATGAGETIADTIEEISSLSPGTGSPGWIFKRRLAPRARVEVLRAVFFDSDKRWAPGFTMLLVMSAGVATLGLSQNSPAVVIGAMAIAPIGSAMAALGAAIALAWPREVLRMLLVTVIGAALVITIAYLIGVLLPTSTPTHEILIRTSPDLRDLGVALFAGAAGAYSETRKGWFAALTGVAIAVALVPPLATVGLMLEERRFALAEGAGLLFGANLVGIGIASSVVMLVTGYAPLPRLRHGGWKSAGLVAGALALTVAIAFPLTRSYLSLLNDASLTSSVEKQVIATLGPASTLVVEHVEVQSNGVTIDLSGQGTVPAASVFEQALTADLGPDVRVTVNHN